MEETDHRVPDMAKRESLLIHIEGLQATLTKRNTRIAELEAQLSLGDDSPTAKRAIAKAYKSGWQDAAGHLMETTRIAVLALGKVRSDAWALYLNKERNKDTEEMEP